MICTARSLVPVLYYRDGLFIVVFPGCRRVACTYQAKLVPESEDGTITMTRLTAISVSALFSVALANAGNIEIGGANGLTASYISSGCAGTACITGSAGSFTENNYDIRLFQAVSNSTFTPYSTYNGSTAEAGTLGTSPQFAMIDDGVGSNGSNNLWMATGTSAIQVPIGLNEINGVSMLLNDLWGAAGAQDTVVTFDFANTSNGSTVDQVVVDLTNSGVAGSAASGQIQSSLDCSTTCGVGPTHFASGPVLASSTPTATLNASPTTVTVTTQDVFSTSYSSSQLNTVGAFAGTSGTINMDALTFTFPAAITPNLYLTEVAVSDPGVGTNVSEAILSAISVNTSATPEPSTIVLLFAGLGLMGYAGFRSRSAVSR